MLDHCIRDYNLKDKRLISNSFLKSWVRKQVAIAGDKPAKKYKVFAMLPRNAVYNFYRDMVNNKLDNQEMQALVACDPTDPDIIYGYSLLSVKQRLIYFIYVQDYARKHGVGLSLLLESAEKIGGEKIGLVCTSHSGDQLIKAYRGTPDVPDVEFYEVNRL